MWGLLLALSLAQPVPSGSSCGPGKNCVASTFKATGSKLSLIGASSADVRACWNNASAGTSGTEYVWAQPFSDANDFSLSWAQGVATSTCSIGNNILYFDGDGANWITYWKETFDDVAEFVGNTYDGQPTCTSFQNQALSSNQSSNTMITCNGVAWDNLTSTGSIYSSSPIAMSHPNLPSGVQLDPNTQNAPRRSEVCYTDPESVANPSCYGVVVAPSVTGASCGSNASDSTISAWGQTGVAMTTGAASGNYCSFEKNVNGWVTPLQFPRLTVTMRPQTATTTSLRMWIGFRPEANTLFTSDTPAGNWAAFRYSTAAGDTEWQACSRDGTTQSCTSTGTAFSTSGYFTFSIEVTSDGYLYRIYDRSSTLLSSTLKTLNLPTVASTTKLYQCSGVETLTSAARTFTFSKSVLEHQ